MSRLALCRPLEGNRYLMESQCNTPLGMAQKAQIPQGEVQWVVLEVVEYPIEKEAQCQPLKLVNFGHQRYKLDLSLGVSPVRWHVGS